jgi:hypothetical protein
MQQGRDHQYCQAYIMICELPEDSFMLEGIKQQGWRKLVHVANINFDESKDSLLERMMSCNLVTIIGAEVILFCIMRNSFWNVKSLFSSSIGV